MKKLSGIIIYNYIMRNKFITKEGSLKNMHIRPDAWIMNSISG